MACDRARNLSRLARVRLTSRALIVRTFFQRVDCDTRICCFSESDGTLDPAKRSRRANDAISPGTPTNLSRTSVITGCLLKNRVPFLTIHSPLPSQTRIIPFAKSACLRWGSRARENSWSSPTPGNGVTFTSLLLVAQHHMSAKTMKRKSEATATDIRPEYDFSKGVRGKYYRRYIESANVVVLAPDVHDKFKNSEVVNEALGTLIRAAGAGRGLTKRPARTRAKATRAGGR